MKIGMPLIVCMIALAAMSCGNARSNGQPRARAGTEETEQKEAAKVPPVITIEKALAYDKHTLDDEYQYGKTTRRFQWDKIKDTLLAYETLECYCEGLKWATLQNYKNKNGVAPEVQDRVFDKYSNLMDKFGVRRYQSIPLYEAGNTSKPVRYGRDGSLVRYLKDSADYVKICSMVYEGEWYVPVKYVRTLDAERFDRAIFVDRTNQNIATLEKSGDKWLVRSMNPATTGLHHPPYQYETPLGTFVIQERKPRMYYTVDGSHVIAGYAPYASRFTQGAYVHGVPLNDPDATEADYIEFSNTLGTTPRSHLCVRTATSHAEFIYNWIVPLATVVVVLE